MGKREKRGGCFLEACVPWSSRERTGGGTVSAHTVKIVVVIIIGLSLGLLLQLSSTKSHVFEMFLRSSRRFSSPVRLFSLKCSSVRPTAAGSTNTVGHDHAAILLRRADGTSRCGAVRLRAMMLRGNLLRWRRGFVPQITLALNRPDMAYSAADALASAMYDSMFDWLVGRVNFAVQVRLCGGFYAGVE